MNHFACPIHKNCKKPKACREGKPCPPTEEELKVIRKVIPMPKEKKK